jgi:cytochrome P450
MSSNSVPGPVGHPIVGNLIELKRDPTRNLIQLSREFGDVVRLRLGPRTLYFLNHPAHVQHILQDNFQNYLKHTRGWNKLSPLFGEGLLTSDGKSWFGQRRLMQPAFHRHRIATFATIMTQVIEEMLERWSHYAEKGQVLDIAPEMMQITLRIMGEVLLSTNVSDGAEVVRDALTVVLHYASDSYTKILAWPLYVPTRRNLSFKKALRDLDQIIYGIIEERRRNKQDPGDLLSMLMHARHEGTETGMNDRELRDQVMTIFMTGHETTANALTWAWYLLAQHPDVARRMQAELNEVLGGRPPALEDLQHLKYTTMVFNEALRLYPPIWVFSRLVKEKDQIDGFEIPAKSTVFISPYALHRRPDFWENPEGFDPDRFDSEKSAKVPRYAYIPFGGGPRECIGINLAMMEGPLILATIAQRYQLHLLPGHRVEMDPSITLRPLYGMKMMLKNIS